MIQHPRVPAFVPYEPPPRRPLDILAVVAVLLSTALVMTLLVVLPVVLPGLLTACAAVCLHRGMCWMLGR